MKKLLTTTIIASFLVFPLTADAVTYVDGYYRDSGTYVEGHYRTEPDQYEFNNYSYDGYDDSYDSSYDSYDYPEYDYDSYDGGYNEPTNDISPATYERLDYSIGDYRY